jgi:aspartate racemase
MAFAQLEGRRMKTIGLIGGMSWESTAVYYRLLNEAAVAAGGELASADVMMHSVNFEEIVRLQKAGDWLKAGAVLAESAIRLRAARADCVLICSNTMHIVSDAVQGAVDIPLIDIIVETGNALQAAERLQPLLLATRYTMEQGFYAQRMQASHGIRPMVPDAKERAQLHDIIFNELCKGIIRDESRAAVLEMIAAGKAAGADSVILGCTEICLLVDADRLELQGFNSTAIHVDAAMRFAR